MKKLALLAVLASALATTAYAGWWRTYGGEGYERGNCIQMTSDGNYIIAAQKDNTLWLIKTDTAGNVIWDSTYDESRGRVTRWLEETNDGGYITAPRTPTLLKVDAQGDIIWSRDYDFYSYCVQETPDDGYIVVGGTNGWGHDESLIVARTNSTGDTNWLRTYTEPGNNENVGYFIQRTNDDSYIITGYTGYVDPEYHFWQKIWLLKINDDGDVLWSRTYGGDEDWEEIKKGLCVRQTSDNGYIITGYLNGLLLLKTNTVGDSIWSKTYISPQRGEGYNVQETQDSGYIITGTTEVVVAYLNSPDRSLWLLKTDGNGDTLWNRIYEGELGHCVQQTNDSGFLVLGATVSHGAGASDVYLLRTDSLGLLSISEEAMSEGFHQWEITSSVGSQIVLRYSNHPHGFQASIFDVSGRRIDELHASSSSGILTWGKLHPAGVYFVKVKNTTDTRTARVVLVH